MAADEALRILSSVAAFVSGLSPLKRWIAWACSSPIARVSSHLRRASRKTTPRLIKTAAAVRRGPAIGAQAFIQSAGCHHSWVEGVTWTTIGHVTSRIFPPVLANGAISDRSCPLLPTAGRRSNRHYLIIPRGAGRFSSWCRLSPLVKSLSMSSNRRLVPRRVLSRPSFPLRQLHALNCLACPHRVTPVARRVGGVTLCGQARHPRQTGWWAGKRGRTGRCQLIDIDNASLMYDSRRYQLPPRDEDHPGGRPTLRRWSDSFRSNEILAEDPHPKNCS